MWKCLFVIQNAALCLSVGFIFGREWYPTKKRKKPCYNPTFMIERG